MATPTAQPDYRAALAEAKRRVDGQKAAGRSLVALAASASEASIATRERAAEHAKRAILSAWDGVNPFSASEVEAFAAHAAKVMSAAQSATATAGAASVTQQMAALGVRVSVKPSAPLDIRAPGIEIARGKIKLIRRTTTVDYQSRPNFKATPADSTTESVFKRPAAMHRALTVKGVPDRDELVRRRIEKLIDDNLMLSQRLGEQEVIAAAAELNQPRVKVIGYRRVIHPELSRGGTCGMCIAASDRIYKIHQLMPIHNEDKCTISPVTAEHDPGSSLNNLDLERLYGDSGGNTVSHLKRTRYQVDEHGELGAVLVPKKPYKPRSTKSKRIAGGKSGSGPTRVDESKADVARRNLPILERNLERLRRQGLDEKSSQIQYHLRTIARMRDALK